MKINFEWTKYAVENDEYELDVENAFDGIGEFCFEYDIDLCEWMEAMCKKVLLDKWHEILEEADGDNDMSEIVDGMVEEITER